MFKYEKLDALMKEMNISSYKVSKMTGISEASLSNWKNGVYKPSTKHLVELSKFFEKPIEYFL